jgi:cellulose synthase/poly-beta-1,6-N-acetylglucosamine synthase-like glycosyltransferase
MQHPELNTPSAVPSISIVIRTHNEAARLKLVLTSLLRATPFEVVVTDDGSIDDTPLVLQQWQHKLPLRVIRHASAKGRSEASNAAARAARGDVLLFLDGDNLVAPGCITAHAKAHALLPNLIGRGETRHLRNTRFLLDPETGTPMPGQESRIARTPPAELDRMKVSTQQVLEDFASIERRSELGIYPGIGPRKLYELEIDALKRQQPQQLLWMTASGCNMSVRRNAFLAIGGFNPQVDLTEQREMAARLCAMGQVMGFVEGGVTYHLSHRSGWRDPLQDTQWEQHLLQTQSGAATRLLPVMWASLADHSPLPTTQRITNLDALAHAAQHLSEGEINHLRSLILRHAQTNESTAHA